MHEECGLEIENKDLQHRGILTFIWDDDKSSTAVPWEVHVFGVDTYSGKPHRTDEMDPHWFLPEDVPFDLMWADDRHW